VEELPVRGEARGGDRPGVDHGVRAAIVTPLDRRQRVERQPGAVDPDALAQRLGTEELADEREHERLGHAHDRELAVDVAGAEHAPAHAHEADAEQVGRHLGERRVDARDVALGDARVPAVRLVDPRLNGLRLRERTSRDVRRSILDRASLRA
jgi:hypothetical protein